MPSSTNLLTDKQREIFLKDFGRYIRLLRLGVKLKYAPDPKDYRNL